MARSLSHDGPQPTLLQAIVGSAMDAIVALDTEQRIVLFNPAAEAMFRCSVGETLGQPLDRFLPDRFRTIHRQHVAAFGLTGDTSRSMGHLRPLTAIRADGEEFPIEATIARVTIDGRPYYAAIVRDITVRQQAEAEHDRSLAREAAMRAESEVAAATRDQLQEILDDLPGGVLLMAAPGARIEFSNLAMNALIAGTDGVSRTLPVYGRDFRFLRADGTPLQHEERPGVRALRGERVHNLQLILQSQDGAGVPVAIHAVPLHDETGVPQRTIVFVQDVTQVRQAEQLKDDFLALVSHELRTPLSAIHGGARVLLNKPYLEAETRAELLHDVVIESERLERLLSNLLALTEITAGRLQASLEPVLLEPLVTSVVEEFRDRSPLHAFAVEVAPALPPAEADPSLLEEVLRNLYENAIKYAPHGGAVRTTLTTEGTTIVTRVSDEGIGIAPDQVATVFERFRRVGGNSRVRGMGLGLYLCRGLVEAQHGHIEASSSGLGHGSTFTVTLPVARGWDESEHA
jgi:PAS domain S-box-containing protein